jgi:hypothetical protein
MPSRGGGFGGAAGNAVGERFSRRVTASSPFAGKKWGPGERTREENGSLATGAERQSHAAGGAGPGDQPP